MTEATDDETRRKLAAQNARENMAPPKWCEDGEDFYAETAIGRFDVYRDPAYGWLVLKDGHDDTFVRYPAEQGEDGFSSSTEAIAAVERAIGRLIVNLIEGKEA